MKSLKRVAVFCGSSLGTDEQFTTDAKKLGIEMAKRGIGLVYGGGNKGIMGILAHAVYDNGGEVIGVLPEAMNVPQVTDNSAHTELRIVKDMHERKNTMYSLSDGFIALPGGIGTIEEITEIYTWRQFGYHDKNIALLNSNGFWNSFIAQMDNCVDLGFLSPEARNILKSSDVVDEILDLLAMEPEELPSKL
ncbi:MAG: TIGR00730 family Rossman fold protein [Spirochaetales bacterium]|nr:TIGR00730 family Rossman fold protein [Spirochaetales bacterium]